MSKREIANDLHIERVLKLIDAMTNDERMKLFERLGVIFQDPVDRCFSAVESMNDEQRQELFGLCDDYYCVKCGEFLGEDEIDHECPYEEDEEGETIGDGEDQDDAAGVDTDVSIDPTDEGAPT